MALPEVDLDLEGCGPAEDTPRVGNLRLAIPIIVFILWLGVLGWMAAQRWFGALL